MAKHIVSIVASTSEFDPKIKAAIREMDRFNETCKRTGASVKYADKEEIAFAKSLGDMNSKATTTAGKLRVMNTLLKETQIAYNKLTAEEKRSPFGKAMASSITQLQAKVKALNSELNKVGLSGGKSSAFGAIFGGNLAARAAMDSIRLFVGGIKSAIQTNMEFEQANANLAAVLGTTRTEITALTQNAKNLGATTVWTAGQITELQTVLARRGFQESQILQMTKGISNLATATGIDLAKAAEIAGSTMQSFGLRASQMGDIVATLGVSTTKSALTMEKLQTSLAYVAPAAKAAGFTLEETVAMLGALADAGLPATTAGVAVRNILVHLSTESSKLSRAIGHPVRSLDEFVAALDELKKDGGDNLEYISSLVEKRIIPGFSVFMSNTAKLKELRDQVSDVRGELQKMADEQINTLNGQVTLLKSAWDGLMLSFSDSKGTLKELTSDLTSAINAWTRFRVLREGGDGVINMYKKGANVEFAEGDVEAFRKGGTSDARIREIIQENLLAETRKFQLASFLYKKDDAYYKTLSATKYFNLLGFDMKEGESGDETRKRLARYIAQVSDEIDTQNYALDLVAPAQAVGGNKKPGGDGGSADEKNNYAVGTLGWMNELLKDYQENLKNTVYGTEEWAAAMQEIKDLQAAISLAQGHGLPGAEETAVMEPGSLEWLNDLLKKYQDNLKKCVYGTEEWHAALQEIKDVQAAINVAQGKGIKTTEDSSDAADDVDTSWRKAAKAVGQVGGAMSSLENPAARVTGIIGQAIANIAAGYAAAVEKAGATGDAGGPWGWIAFAAAGAATMISSIAAIKSATEYHADGGFIGGGPRGTDIVPMYGTPGELVLNAAQQSALAGQLQGGYGNLHIEKVIGAEEIRLILTNNNRRRHRGENAIAL